MLGRCVSAEVGPCLPLYGLKSMFLIMAGVRWQAH